jgi:hypothetical protein
MFGSMRLADGGTARRCWFPTQQCAPTRRKIVLMVGKDAKRAAELAGTSAGSSRVRDLDGV